MDIISRILKPVRTYIQSSIRRKLMITISGAAVLPLVVITIFCYGYSWNTSIQNNQLLVDDEFSLCFAELALKDHLGYVLFDNESHTVSALSKKAFNLIFTDINSSVFDGTKFLRLNCEFNMHTLVIAMTAGAVKGTLEELLKTGFTDYFSKPFKPERQLAYIECGLKKAG